LAVRGEPDVELDPATLQLLCFAQSGKRIFRRTPSGATMADHRGEELFEVTPL